MSPKKHVVKVEYGKHRVEKHRGGFRVRWRETVTFGDGSVERVRRSEPAGEWGTQANDLCKKLEREHFEIEHGISRASVTIKEAFDSFIKTKEEEAAMEEDPLSPETLSFYKNNLPRIMGGAWSIRADQLNAQYFKDFMKTYLTSNRKKTGKKHTKPERLHSKNGLLTLFRGASALINYMIIEGWCDKNVLDAVKKPKAVPVGRYIEPQEFERILSPEACLDDELRDMLIIYYNTGLRLSELLKARKEDIVPEGAILVPRWNNKTREHKTIGVRQEIMPYLNRVKSGLLFPGWTRDKLEQAWTRTKVRAGIKEFDSRGKRMRTSIHDMRHSYATWMLSNGLSLAEAAELLGHRHSKTTETIYKHLVTEHVIASAARVPSPINLTLVGGACGQKTRPHDEKDARKSNTMQEWEEGGTKFRVVI